MRAKMSLPYRIEMHVSVTPRRFCTIWSLHLILSRNEKIGQLVLNGACMALANAMPTLCSMAPDTANAHATIDGGNEQKS